MLRTRSRLLFVAAAVAAVAISVPMVSAGAAPVTTSTVAVNLFYADGTVAYPAYAYVANVSGGTGDPSGHAVLTGLPAQTRVRLCGDDLGPRSDKPDWPGALATCINTLTPAAGGTKTVTVRLADAASVRGVVREPGGQPMNGGYVDVRSTSRHALGAIFDVDSSGQILSQELPPGDYTVCGVDPPDQAAGCVGGAFFAPQSTVVHLTSGAYTPVDFTLSPAFTLHGHLTLAADGSPVLGAALVIRDSATRAVVSRGTTGTTDGSWGTGPLPMRPVSVCATPDTDTVPDDVLPVCITYRPLSVADHTLELTARSGGAVDGGLTDQAGAPVGGATVEVYRLSSTGASRVRTVLTASTGAWSTGTLAPGPYTVCFRAADVTTPTAPHGFTSQCWNNRPYVPAHADRITVVANSSTGPVVGRLVANP